MSPKPHFQNKHGSPHPLQILNQNWQFAWRPTLINKIGNTLSSETMQLIWQTFIDQLISLIDAWHPRKLPINMSLPHELVYKIWAGKFVGVLLQIKLQEGCNADRVLCYTGGKMASLMWATKHRKKNHLHAYVYNNHDSWIFFACRKETLP